MSGHSKWSKIKRKKAGADQKKGQLFSKLSKSITIAAQKGGDPETNHSLRLEIDRAKSAGMTQETIGRAIKKGTGEDKEGTNINEVVYEAYGPGGAALLIKAATDNRNRTSSNIKHILSKFGGKMGGPGSVGYIFASGEATFRVDLDEQQKAKLTELIQALEDDEDILSVTTNANSN